MKVNSSAIFGCKIKVSNTNTYHIKHITLHTPSSKRGKIKKMDNLEIESLIAEKIDKAVADALANREAESRAITERLSRVEETLLARMNNNNVVSRDEFFDCKSDIMDEVPISGNINCVDRDGEGNVVAAVDDDALTSRINMLESKVDEIEGKDDMRGERERDYALPDSTFTLMITEKVASVPFAFAVCASTLSVLCLSLTLAEAVSKATHRNKLGIPKGVSKTVNAAQFVGILV